MKRAGTAVYVHKSALNQLKDQYPEAYRYAQTLAIEGFEYDIVKWDYYSKAITFLMSPDWDTAREPLVGDAIRVNTQTWETKRLRSRGQIYHHKHEFVNDDYTGFDLEESRQWSKLWKATLPNTREITTRIGYKKYWIGILKEYGLA